MHWEPELIHHLLLLKGKENHNLVPQTHINAFSDIWVFFPVTRLMQSITLLLWRLKFSRQRNLGNNNTLSGSNSSLCKLTQTLSAEVQGSTVHTYFPAGHQGTSEYLPYTHRVFWSKVTEHQSKCCLGKGKESDCFWGWNDTEISTLLFWKSLANLQTDPSAFYLPGCHDQQTLCLCTSSLCIMIDIRVWSQTVP